MLTWPRFSGAALILNIMSLCPPQKLNTKNTNILAYRQLLLDCLRQLGEKRYKSLFRQCALPLAEDLQSSVKSLFLSAWVSLRQSSFFVCFQNLIGIIVFLVLLLSVKKYLIVFVEWPTCFLLGSTTVSVVCVSPGST